MKPILLIILLTLSFSTLSDVTGDWHGVLAVQGTKLRISFHIIKNKDNYTSTMDSHDQGALGIPTTSTIYNGNTLKIIIKNIGVHYEAVLNEETLIGTFNQGGMSFPLELNRKIIKKEESKARPQDPVKPYPYISEDVIFKNLQANNIKLAGTLTLPKNIKKPPVAILISGSGPQNRDEEIKAFNHRPFLVWSDYLTRHGIAVLRFDDRGVNESEGSQKGATSADFATDVKAAVTYLKTRADVIDTSKIGLIGHSEGGLIAPMVAANNKDIAYIVLLAGPGVDGEEILLTQSKRAAELAGESKNEIKLNQQLSKHVFEMVKAESNLEKLTQKIISYLLEQKKNNANEMPKELTEEKIKQQAHTVSSAWMSYFIRSHPADNLSLVKCPTLAINGELDFQVLPQLNLRAIKKSLTTAGNKDVTIKQLKGLNHLFQMAKTGALDEYALINETVSPMAMALVEQWINKRFGEEKQ